MSANNYPGEILTATVIGCGRMGADLGGRKLKGLPPGWRPLSHAEAIQATPGLELIGFCDPDSERLNLAAGHFGVDACFNEAAKMIRELSPDIITIATRTPERCGLIKLAVENGVRGIHAEKPLGRNMTECRDALAAVVHHGVKLTYGTTRRFMDVYLKARDLVAAGTIGKLQHICIEHGRDMLLWSHPHSIDLMLFYNDCLEVDYVQASCDVTPGAVNARIVDQDPVVENVAVKFANGVIGAITQTGGFNTSLTGSKGTITVVADGTNIEIRRRREPSSAYFLDVEELVVSPKCSGTERAITQLREAVTGGALPSISLDHIECGQRILLAIARSSISGGIRQTLDEVEDDFTVTGRFGELFA